MERITTPEVFGIALLATVAIIVALGRATRKKRKRYKGPYRREDWRR